MNCGVGQTIVRLFRAGVHIKFHVGIRICYSHNYSLGGKISGERYWAVSGVFNVCSVDKSDCGGISGELGDVALSFSSSKNGFSSSHSHALAYNSSCLRLTSGSGFYSCGVIRTSGVGWRGLN